MKSSGLSTFKEKEVDSGSASAKLLDSQHFESLSHMESETEGSDLSRLQMFLAGSDSG